MTPCSITPVPSLLTSRSPGCWSCNSNDSKDMKTIYDLVNRSGRKDITAAEVQEASVAIDTTPSVPTTPIRTRHDHGIEIGGAASEPSKEIGTPSSSPGSSLAQSQRGSSQHSMADKVHVDEQKGRGETAHQAAIAVRGGSRQAPQETS